MEEQDVVKSLAALARPQGLTPGDLCIQLEVPATTLSFHLKELMYAQLISQERDGRHLIYRAAFEHMDGLLSYLTEHCCQGQPCAPVAHTSNGKPTRKRACAAC
jgi:ArsR family transcriptional regulator, arsenate/arsenite/antimonite-responsive transcriptional repressor